MGNSLSLSGRDTLSGEDLKRNSKEITEMSNALFQFMYTNWQPRDVWEIANDPSKYVIAISDMITAQFHVLGYKTKSGRIGEIYFQKWDALEPPMDKDQLSAANSRNSSSNNAKVVEKRRSTRRQRSEAGYPAQKQNAEIIAFYFVRIFQILGAMLLVVKDINIPDYNPETGETLTSAVTSNALRNYAQQSHQVVSGFRPPTFKGGARDNFSSAMPLGPYDFLRYYLRRISPEDLARFSIKGIRLDTNKEYMFNGSDTMLFEFTPYTGLNEIGADNKTFQKIGFAVKTTSGNEKRYINISVKQIFFDISHTEEQTLSGYKAPSDRDEKTRLSSYPVRLTLEYDVPGKKSSVMLTRVSELPSNLSLGVEYQFSSDDLGMITFLKSQGMHIRNDFVKILESISTFFLKQVNGSVEIIKFDTVKKVETEDGKPSTKPPKNKSLETTHKELVNKDYQPHCIARALQLLDPASINNFKTGTAISNVCVPKLGGTTKSLSEYVPTRSVGQLYGKINPLDHKASIEVLKAFAQKDSSGDPLTTDGVNNVPSEVTELQAAIKRLSTAFGIEYTNQRSLSGIEIKVSKKCDPSKDLGKPVQVIRESNKFRDMKSASQQLLAYHLKQIIEISKFLKKIFNISQRPDGSWKVEGPKTELLFAGFETMNSLTDQARALLINYYAGCEEIYQKGVKAWEVDIVTAGDKPLSNAPAIGQALASPNKPAVPVIPSAPKV
jgi:hypothetical protein